MQVASGGRAVVVGVDGSECALHAVRWAAAEAARRRTALRLVSAYGWPVGRWVADPGLALDYRELLRSAASAQLAAAAKAAADAAPGLEVEQTAVAGYPVSVLQAVSAHAAVVVLGSRGAGGFADLMAGSVAVTLAAHASCPVVVVRDSEPAATAPRTGPVVLGVDGSPVGEAAIAFAFDAAASREVPLVAVHAFSDLMLDPTMQGVIDVDPVAEQEVLAERLAGWSEKYPQVPVRRRLVRDRPARALVEESAGAQLVVVGSRGRGGLAGMLLGSVSGAVLRHAHCPVAIARPTAQTEGDRPH